MPADGIKLNTVQKRKLLSLNHDCTFIPLTLKVCLLFSGTEDYYSCIIQNVLLHVFLCCCLDGKAADFAFTKEKVKTNTAHTVYVLYQFISSFSKYLSQMCVRPSLSSYKSFHSGNYDTCLICILYLYMCCSISEH